MKTRTVSRRFGMLVVLGALASVAERPALGDSAATAGAAKLNWTPHRSAASAPAAAPATAPAGETAVVAATPRAAAAPPQLQSVPSAAVSVQLPDGVPPVESRQNRPAPAGVRPRPASPSISRRPALEATSPDAILGVDIFRAPTRGATRPILADESPTARGRAARGPVERLGGGLAPRYDGGRRPERLAAGVDALPSVMKQSPALPDAAEATPPEAIAAPAAQDAAPSIIESLPDALEFGDPAGMDDPALAGGPDGLMLGEYPSELHVESFYDDPYACEDDDPLCHHSGRFCAWLRRFGRPYYGWRWYRDFTVGAGVVGFTNQSDLGLGGNFGVDEFANQGMPFWNAFGVGWQVGVRGTQTNFQSSSTEMTGGRLQRSGREQVFVTTGFFTRAFEGRGLQGGAVYDYLHDNWFDDTDVAQLRYELSYVWGYHELGFWGATNIGDQNGIFSPITKTPGVASTLDLYTAFYRLQFGDANEWKVWGGASGYGDGVVGSIVRAPMARQWALEGFFTYVIPGNSQTIDLDGQGTMHNYSPAAWNVGVNVVFYPGGRSRRSLSSPYRPLFDVADNGTMIRRLGAVSP